MLISLVFMMVIPVLCFQCPIPLSSHATNVICIFIAPLPTFTMSYVMFVYRFTVNIQLPTQILAQIGCLHKCILVSEMTPADFLYFSLAFLCTIDHFLVLGDLCQAIFWTSDYEIQVTIREFTPMTVVGWSNNNTIRRSTVYIYTRTCILYM